MILLTLFVGASIVRNSHESAKNLDYNLNDLANNKILIINDEDGEFSNTKFGVALRSIVESRVKMPLKKSNVEKIEKLKNVDKTYPYYIFQSKHRNAINVYRNGEVIEMKKNAVDVWNSPIPEYYAVVPSYDEEIDVIKEGIYVGSLIANKYNILPGDDVELFLEVPVAIEECLYVYYDKESDAYIGGDHYQTATVTYKTKVIGIMDENSFQPEVYMRYKDMEVLLQDTLKKYKKGEKIPPR